MVIDTAKDYYRVLGVTPGARADEIRLGYRQCAFRCHPDKGGSHHDMVAINEAGAILLNPARRALYDSLRHGKSATAGDRWVRVEARAAVEAETGRSVCLSCPPYHHWWRNCDFWNDLAEWTGYAAAMGVVLAFAFLVGLAMIA